MDVVKSHQVLFENFHDKIHYLYYSVVTFISITTMACNAVRKSIFLMRPK